MPARRSSFIGAIALLAISACAVFTLSGCQKKNQFVAPPPPEVIVATPQQRDVTEYLDVTGTAHPVETVEIRARVRGFLKEKKVEEGSAVRAGDLLLVIDELPFKVALQEAEANYAAANTALTQATQSQSRPMMRAQLALDQSQLALAQSEERRMEPLVKSKMVSQEDMDRAIATRQQMEAKVASTTANLAQVDADYETNINGAKAKLAAAQTAVQSAQINLGYCRVTSPIDGRIGRVNYDVGNLVGDAQSTLLTTIVKYTPVQVYASLSVDEYLKYRSVAGEPEPNTPPDRQWPVDLNLAGETGYKHHGRIDYHDPMVDRGTGTIQVRGVFPNVDGIILPGMFARLRIPIGRKANALLVPESAISTDQLGQYVYVVDSENKVGYRHVETGQVVEGMRVIEGKVGPQDRVIVEGLLRARPGLQVVPKTEVVQASPEKSDVAQGERGTQ